MDDRVTEAIRRKVRRIAEEEGVNPELFSALVRQESAYDPDAVNPKSGAIGLGQLMPTTAQELGVDPRNIDQNLRGSARYLNRQMTRFGSEDLGLAAYNAGPRRVAEYGGVPPFPETQDYIRKIRSFIGPSEVQAAEPIESRVEAALRRRAATAATPPQETPQQVEGSAISRLLSGDMEGFRSRYSERLGEEQAKEEAEQTQFAGEHPFLSTLRGAARPTFTTGLLARALPERAEQALLRAEQRQQAIEAQGAEQLGPVERGVAQFAGGAARLPEFGLVTAAEAPVAGPAAPFTAAATIAGGETLMQGGSYREAVENAAKATATFMVARGAGKIGRAVPTGPLGGAAASIARRGAAGVSAAAGAGGTALATGATPEEALQTAGTFAAFEGIQRPIPRNVAEAIGTGPKARPTGRRAGTVRTRPVPTGRFNASRESEAFAETKGPETPAPPSPPAQTDAPGIPLPQPMPEAPPGGHAKAIDAALKTDPTPSDPTIDNVLKKIDFGGELSGKSRPFRDRVSQVYQNWFDRFYPVKQLRSEVEKATTKARPESPLKLSPSQRPDELARFYAKKASSNVRFRVEVADVDEHGNVLGPSLVDIMRPVLEQAPRNNFGIRQVRNTYKEFVAYASLKRALGLEYRNMKSGFFDENFTREDGQRLVQRLKNPAWDAAADGITKWSGHTVDRIVRATGMSQREAQIMRDMNPVYIPFARVFDPGSLEDLARVGAGGRSNPLRRIKGSERAIYNPMEELIRQHTHLTDLASRAEVWKTVTSLAGLPGSEKWVKAIPLKGKPQRVQVRSIKSQLQNIGLEVPEQALDKVVEVFNLSPVGKQRNVITGRHNGKLRSYAVRPELYDAIEGLPPNKQIAFPGLVALEKLTKLKRLGITEINPAFFIRNLTRDFGTYTAYSKNPWATPLQAAWGVKQAATAAKRPGTPEFRARASGIFTSGFIGQDRADWMRAQDDLINRASGRKAVYVARHPIDSLRAILVPGEMGPRMAEIRHQMGVLAKQHPEWNDEDVFTRAFNDAQDVTLNFSGGGLKAQQLNRIVAFFNANMLGLDKTVRTFKDRPIQTFAKAAGILTPIALANWYANKDKPWYRNADTRYRISNLFFDTGTESGGEPNIIRLPIPFEVGTVFMAMPVAIADYHYEKVHQFKDHADALGYLFKSQIPPVVPDVLGPAFDVARDKDFLGRPIEGMALRRMPAYQRSRRYTSQYALSVAKAGHKMGFEWSPVVIDYLVNNYTGGLPYFVGLPKGEVKAPVDLPLTLGRLFVRDPLFPREAVNVFFNHKKDLEEAVAGTGATMTQQYRQKVFSSTARNAIGPLLNEIEAANAANDRAALPELYRNLNDTILYTFDTANVDFGDGDAQ